MQKILRLHLTEKSVPIVLLAATSISFGLLIPRLGFYWDDWPVIYLTHTQGISGFWDFYQYDRPYSAWTYIVFAPLLGTYPIRWHIFALLLRWLTAVLIWMVMKKIWGQAPFQATAVALLFTVCPIFTFQPVAVAYSQHWLCYLLYFLSVYFMLRAQEPGVTFWWFTLLSAATGLLEMFTLEYFLGLELLRPVFLWIYLRERHPKSMPRELLKQTARASSIYLILVVAYATWRIFFLQLAEADPNRPIFLIQLNEAPLLAIVDLAEKVLQDIVYLLTAWLVMINPADLDFQRPFALAVLLIVIFSGSLFWFVLQKFQSNKVTHQDSAPSIHVFIMGIAAVLLGMLPVWMIGRQASVGPLGNRFSFAAIFGVCVILVAVLEWLSPKIKAKNAVLCTLFALATHSNLYNAKSYELSWEKQREFYWQLFWRAPFIESGTPLISEGEVFPSVGLYSTSMAISMIYPIEGNPQRLPYWFFSYWEKLYKNPESILAGTPLDDGLRNYHFFSESKNAVILDYSPEENRCLHILSDEDVDTRNLLILPTELLSLSNLQRVHRDLNVNNWSPPESIFGPEPEHGWCYYYQKAELANQFEDWEEVISLMKKAEEESHTPSDPTELLHLLRAQLELDNYDEAYSLTIHMSRISNKIDDPLCHVWIRAIQARASPEITDMFNRVREKINCFD